MKHRAALALACVVLASSARAVAQDRPFVFSLTTAPTTETMQIRADIDVGAGDGAFRSSQSNGPEQRVAVQLSKGRLTVIGRFDLASSPSTSSTSYETSQAAEALVSFGSKRLAVAAGGGVLHEATGVDVLLARVVAGRETDAWRAHGNMLLQAPISSTGRDAVDVLTTVVWARKITPALAVGVEAIGEDLEGFWEAREAEGGARLLVGPTIHVAPTGRSWQITATGGPTVHPSDTGRSSPALRDLPPTAKRVGYAVRTAFTIKVF